MTVYIWVGIGICLLQSAIFSGLNLAFFSVNRLELEVAGEHNQAARKVLSMRQDANFLLTTILWGNVGINVLMALLSNSILAGVSAFVFSTVFITLFGEIIPQAYFSRHALKMAALLAPILRFYQIVLYPVAKPCAKLLDLWLGKEGIVYLRERDLHRVIRKHMEAEESELDILEGLGALNFLKIDDQPIGKEGEPIDPLSIIELPSQLDHPVLPDVKRATNDPFIHVVQASGKKWVVLVDNNNQPQAVLNADSFIRAALFDDGDFNPYHYCHRPIIVRNANTPLGDVVGRLRIGMSASADDVIENDIILLWTDRPRIITGADILGRLLKGIQAPSRH